MDKFSKLKPEQQMAIEMLTMQHLDMKAKRLTYQQIADACGCSSKALYNWRNFDKTFIAAREEFTEARADEMLAKAYGTLNKQMTKGNVKAVEIFLKSRGKLVDKSVSDITVTDNNSVEEKQRKLDELRARAAINESE